MRVAVTAVSVVCPAGDASGLSAALAHGRSFVRRPDDARGALPIPGVAEAEVDVRPFLRRRKDRKLLARAAHLAIPAARQALGDLPPQAVGLFLGVGREPPEDETEAAIVASGRDGLLDPVRLGADGLALYPPLASLRTLPNLVLAHVAIQLGLRGEGGTCAGDGAASIAAILEGAWAVEEGRCEVVLAGGADSRTHPALVRDQVRRGIVLGAGEAAVILRLERPESAEAAGRPILAEIRGGDTGFGADAPRDPGHWEAIGWCGAADGALAFAGALGGSGAESVILCDHASARGTLQWGVRRARPQP